MGEQLNFNDIILRLLTFWKDHNCLLWQPYNVQVGAGTMNPGTVLRVLGPEPWNIVYVEPSIRPDDGRFGDNPNRMQQHYQLQVILKPDPGNPQELYLKSLEAIGINPREHDIRFVEDNWESPALGAWGLGWEVWLDGQEITQFTYFQQTGGLDLDPVSVELTYGLDRISLALQGANSVWDMDYGVGISYGNVLLQAEIEHCNYYFHGADVEALREVYDVYEREAERNIAAGLVIPAHDYNLKCSHLFNILDTRGAIGVTERAQYFRRMRQIARRVSELYVAQREQLGFPLLNHPAWATPRAPLSLTDAPTDVGDVAQTFVLEIGSEELPAGDLASALRQLRVAVPAMLDELRLTYRNIQVVGTPRRLAVLVAGLAPRQTDLVTEVKGPPADRAFDADGRPTRAAEGFARSRGLDVAELRVISEGDRKYVAATVHEAGRAVPVVLAERLPDLIAGIRFDKSMRWNHTNIAYSRPLRWLVALYGEHVVPIAYAGVVSDRTTHGLRPYGSPPIALASADRYRAALSENHIILDENERRASILTQIQALAAAKGGEVRDDGALLEEVANLVEAPVAMLGSFERTYLDLPTAALVAVMKKHQRYFPVYDTHGGLMPYFIAVRNGDEEYLDKVVEGNEHVIRARFADADFFYHNDIKKPLEAFLPDLKTLTFQTDLGSMWDKVRRLEHLVLPVAEMLGLTMAERATVERAATLSKADLATSFVVEMTSLQGIMGAQYALSSGEPADVANALAEQYEAVSSTGPSLALALSDRIDSLVGLFAAGLAPKGSNDPFALRRAALQIIENLVANQVSFDLRPTLAAAAGLLPLPAGADVQRAVLEFTAGRLEVVLREKGAGTHVVRAVLAEQAHDPYAASQAVRALEEALEASDWPRLLDAYARCVRITRGEKTSHALRPEAFGLAAEKELFAAYGAAQEKADGTVSAFVASLRGLEPAITRFFEDVLVMDEDLAIRSNRLALLQHIAGLARGIADLSELEGF